MRFTVYPKSLEVLLMVEVRLYNHRKKPVVHNGINYQPQLVSWISSINSSKFEVLAMLASRIRRHIERCSFLFGKITHEIDFTWWLVCSLDIFVDFSCTCQLSKVWPLYLYWGEDLNLHCWIHTPKVFLFYPSRELLKSERDTQILPVLRICCMKSQDLSLALLDRSFP